MNERPSNEDRETLLSESQDRPLEPSEAEELAFLADLLADDATWQEPNADLEDAVLRAVAGAPATATAPAPAPAATTATSTTRARAPRRRWIARTVLAAAALAVALGLVAVLRSSSGPDYKSNLAATNLAPGAHGSADIVRNNSGFRITLHATGLVPLGAGQYYQAWLKNATGTLVPVGTFSSSAGKVTLWSGVSPDTFRTITVTIESADNDQTSSGRRVLVGDVRPG